MAPTTFSAALCCILMSLTLPVLAQGATDQCNDILKQSFNTSSKSSQSSTSERAFYREYLFTLKSTEAFKEYEKAWESSKKQGTAGSGEGHYFAIGGAFDFTHTYDRKLTGDEFDKAFNNAKSEYDRNSTSTNEKNASLISLYQSSVRDANSVRAWEECMTKRDRPELVAYGYRDPSGSPYVVVIWAPGVIFGADNPNIRLNFALTDPAMAVVGGEKEVHLGVGSGRAFPIRFNDPNNRKANADGFSVLVNGQVKGGANFQTAAVVPRNLGTMPCTHVFDTNRAYQLGVFDTKKREMNWNFAEVLTMNRASSDRPGNPTYNARLNFQGKQGPPMVVRVTGANVSVLDDKGIVFLAGECTGQGIRARFANSRFAAGAPEVSIRPR